MFCNKKCFFMLILIGTLFITAYFGYSQSKTALPVQDKKKEIQTSITYCNLEVPAFWKEANSNFYLMYSLKVNEKGDLIEVKKIRDDVVGEQLVMQCIAGWKISGFPDKTNFVVSFKWQHGKGWVEQTISGKGFKQTTNIEDIGY